MQLKEGDIVSIESPTASVDVPVYVSPAAPPEVLAMPLGQGHSSFGRWATRRGVNALTLLSPLADTATGALAYGSTRVRLRKTGRSGPLPKLEGVAPVRQLPDHEVLKVLEQ
jgi:molybdopterin-containing oxidoreductase family iron-sulfur binding subunit